MQILFPAFRRKQIKRGMETFHLPYVNRTGHHVVPSCSFVIFSSVNFRGCRMIVQNEQTEQKQGKSLLLVTRRRTLVRRVAKFVYSAQFSMFYTIFIAVCAFFGTPTSNSCGLRYACCEIQSAKFFHDT